jgi:maleamate amidohydrolase
VRATVVDGMSLGYRMVVPVEAVSDRARTPHRSALFDMGHKYADVLREREVLSALAP